MTELTLEQLAGNAERLHCEMMVSEIKLEKLERLMQDLKVRLLGRREAIQKLPELVEHCV